jgi:peroxiredoxin
MKQLIILFFAVWAAGSLAAQSVQVHFPHFAGRNYVFYIHQGTQTDTLQTGAIDADGHLLLSLPEDKKDYRGVAVWSLGNKESLSFLLAGEDFSIKCTEPLPSEANISYQQSPENDRLIAFSRQQGDLFQKIDLIYRGKELYKDNKKLSSVFDQELKELGKTFEHFQQELNKSDTYASHYLQLRNFLNGMGSRLFAPDEDSKRQDDLIRFVNEDLNMDALFTSGYWNAIISITFDLFPDHKDFAGAMINNLKRTRSPQVFDALAHDLVMICEQFGWPEAEDMIVYYLMESKRITQPRGMLHTLFEMNKVKPGDKAFPITGIDDLSNTLLIFYDSGCDNCNVQINELKQRYTELQERGLRIVSIAADTQQAVFEAYSNRFLWQDRLCDYQGFNGENFRNYGVVATPSMFLIDGDGIVTGKYARLEDFLVSTK